MRSTKCGFNEGEGLPPASDRLVTWGPTLMVDIGFDANYSAASKVSPVPGVTGLHALVDTGATESCIDTLLAAKLKLPIVDRRSVSGVHGAKEVDVYLAQVHIVSLRYTIYGAFAGVDLRAGGQLHSALIGRTFLKQFKMIYDGTTGDVELTGNI
jgi:predicted aspartyl protease